MLEAKLCTSWKDLTQQQSINPFIPAQKYEKTA